MGSAIFDYSMAAKSFTASIIPWNDFVGFGDFFVYMFWLLVKLLLIIIGVVILVAVFKKIKKTIRKNEHLKQYDKLDKQSQVEVYHKLIKYRDSCYQSKSYSEKSKSPYNGKKAQEKALIGAIAKDTIANECSKTLREKYGIYVCMEFIEYDIPYLREKIGRS